MGKGGRGGKVAPASGHTLQWYGKARLYGTSFMNPRETEGKWIEKNRGGEFIDLKRRTRSDASKREKEVLSFCLWGNTYFYVGGQ